MIQITSFKKQKWVDGTPTDELYTVSSWINPDNIVSILSTKTSISDTGNNIDYYAEGSKINMVDGATLIADINPKELVELIDSCFE
jgi:hypothetical protein